MKDETISWLAAIVIDVDDRLFAADADFAPHRRAAVDELYAEAVKRDVLPWQPRRGDVVRDAE